MHIALEAGHNSAPGDTGATGFDFEDTLTFKLAAELKLLLEAAEHKVTLCQVPQSKSLGESLKRRVAIANTAGADLYVSLHFNKFLEGKNSTKNAMGSEIYVASNQGRKVAQKIMPQLTKIGFKIHDAPGNSGIKEAGYYVLVHTDMPAILIESFFLDSEADYTVFMRVGIKGLAAAIAVGLLA